jgi:hypothetical protein
MHTAVAAREREAVMVVLAALLGVVERVEPERPVLREAVVVGWSVATLMVEVRPLQAAEARFAACDAPLQAGREAETGNMVRQTKRAVPQYREVTAEDTLAGPWMTTWEWAVGAAVYLPATRGRRAARTVPR